MSIVLRFVACALLLAGCIAAPPPLPEPPPDRIPKAFPIDAYRDAARRGRRVFRVDAQSSLIQVFVYRAGTLAAKGHNHVVAVRDLLGFGFADEQGRWHGDLSLAAQDFTVDDPALREAAGEGFESTPNAKDIDGTRRNMLGPKALNAGETPHIFASLRDVDVTQAAQVLSIELTIGTTRRVVQVPARLELLNDRLTISGEAALNQTDFGIEPFSILGGAIRVANEVRFTFEITAQATSNLAP